MLKYGDGELVLKITQIFQNILTQCEIHKSWKESLIIPIFKKGNKADLNNYRGITLLNTILKLFTKIILNKLPYYIKPREEQQGFRKNSSTTDAIFIIRQIVKNQSNSTTRHTCVS